MSRVMVTDDEREAADTLAMVLREEGHDVQIAYSGEQALAAAPAFGPEVLLVDFLLSDDIDGGHVARRLRESNPKLRVVVMSGLPESELRARLRQFSFDYVPKPVDLERVLEAVTIPKS